MLNKLLKYDLKYIYKSQIFLYGITIICLIIAKIFQKLDPEFFIYYSINLSFLIFTYAMLFVLTINNLTKLWGRFRNTVYGEESYLIHTLPVTKKDIYLSKIISSIVTLTTTSFLVFIVDLIIRDFRPIGVFVYSDTETDPISTFLSQYLSNFQTHTMMWFMLLIVLIAVSLIGYYSLILGYTANRKKLTNSIIIGASLFLLTFTLNFVFYFAIGIFNEGISDFIWKSTLTNDSEKAIITITCFFYIMAGFVYYLLGLKNLKNGINVE